MTLFSALETRVARDGARPLLTWYQPSSGARVEFSAITLANWVDKTVNLLGDLGVDDDAVVAAPLLVDHPAHWVSAVWALASWQVGARLEVAQLHDISGAEVVVLGPEGAARVPGADTIVCSLHPLGLGLSEPVPGVVDYHEVLTQPDLHSPAVAVPTEVWMSSEAGERTGGQISSVPPSSARVLVQPHHIDELIDALVAAITGGGSVVVIDGAVDDSQLARIRADERVD